MLGVEASDCVPPLMTRRAPVDAALLGAAYGFRESPQRAGGGAEPAAGGLEEQVPQVPIPTPDSHSRLLLAGPARRGGEGRGKEVRNRVYNRSWIDSVYAPRGVG
jgi:hypothetical protein